LTDEDLNKFIANPKASSGTAMGLPASQDSERRRDRFCTLADVLSLPAAAK
jgi:hypothetical protein